MATIYDKIDTALKEIRRIQDLIKQGLAKPEEKQQAFQIVNDITDLFTNEIFKRKAEKIRKGETNYTLQTRDGFVAPHEADQFNDWINLFEEFKEKRKIKTELSSEKTNIQSVVDGEDQHILITEKGSGDHAHLILDEGTGEIRIDPKDKSPHELIKSIEAKLTLKTGEVIQITKSAITFVEPEAPKADVRAYTASKDSYSVLEIYNNGDEDLEDFQVKANWTQPEGEQERILDKFNGENDYLVMAHPRSLTMLKKGERVYSHIPTVSVDKKIKITIACKGMRNGQKIEKVFNLETENKY